MDKPWGSFFIVTENTTSTVKIITVNKAQRTSLQYHKNRNEWWLVIKGRFKITQGLLTSIATEGMEFYIPKGEKHRLEGIDNENKLLEISTGVFDENDVIRLKDDYGRC